MSKLLSSVAVLFVVASSSLAQEAPKPAPEHARLKELAGTWDCYMNGAKEPGGVCTMKSELGGLWLTSEFKGEFGGMKFEGRGLDSYDPMKKKYIGVWVDSFSTSPMVSEGTMDAGGKVLTMTGEGPGPDGKPTKYKMVSEYKDKDTIDWVMYNVGADGKEAQMLSIVYKRKK